MTLCLWGVIILSGVISLTSPFVWRRLLTHAGVFDTPNERSSHTTPTLRGGGIAPLASLLFGGLVLMILLGGETRLFVAGIVIASALVGFVGLAEDIFGLPMIVRAAIQITIGGFYALTLSWITENNWIWIPLVAIFFAANVNFTNFMDGINGISSLYGLVTGLAFAWMGASEGHLWLVILGLLTAVIFATFLPWNLVPPGMFLGDAGSYLLGSLTGAMAIAAIWAGVHPVMAMSPLSVYWVDAVYTLVKRFLKRKPIFEAHRTHIYQQLTDGNLSHITVAIIVAVFTGMVSLAGIGASSQTPSVIGFSVTVLAILWAAYLTLPWLINKRKIRIR